MNQTAFMVQKVIRKWKGRIRKGSPVFFSPVMPESMNPYAVITAIISGRDLVKKMVGEFT